ncbi:MAG: nucleotidyltransferase family protein, partial [Planctomycetes bacterium]|nr:nucleotidyltransferase family protein [Planctomycetota bacterium]
DVRRAIITGLSVESPLAELLEQKSASPYPAAVTAPIGTGREAIKQIMLDRDVAQVPLLDLEGKPSELLTLDEFLPNHTPPIQAVIMAGGFGTRLRPLTDELPKPMLPVGGRPLIELVVERLRDAGVCDVSISTYYKPEKIVQHFGDGEKFGVEVKYITEDRPLGTAGALGLLPRPDKPLLVLNGDVLTGIDYRAMVVFHREQDAELTVAVRKYEVTVPYGVVENDGLLVQRLTEKPTFDFFVNAGIYVLEPTALEHIRANERTDMTDLIQRLVAEGKTVVSFPIHEYWLDIGQPDDYQRAQQDVASGQFTLRAA